MNDQGDPQLTHLLDGTRPLFNVEPLPATADVVIIGGGIVGVSTGYFLAQAGLKVVLCEKGRLAAEQSGRNWGWVRQQGRAQAELPMMMRSNAIWRHWQEQFDTGFEVAGCLYLAETEKELDENTAWLEIAKTHGLASTMLTRNQLRNVVDPSSMSWAGALYTVSDGKAEPSLAVPAIATAARSLGLDIIERCAVRGVETSGGKISHVVTEQGVIATQQVVCAAGAWSSFWCGSLGVEVPQLKIKGTVGRLAPCAQVIKGTAWAADVAIRRRQDGGYTVAHGSALEHALVPDSFRRATRFVPALLQEKGAARVSINGDFFSEMCRAKRWPLDRESVFERERVLGPSPSKKILKQVRLALKKYYPIISDTPFVETWAGMIDVTPDLIPILGSVDDVPGLTLATGFSGHGFGLGPGAGEALAAKICEDFDRPFGGAAYLSQDHSPVPSLSSLDLSPFRWSRFFDGSKLVMGPTV